MSEITEPQYLIPVIRIVNPFDPRDHVRETLVWDYSKVLADYFPVGMVEYVISINGKVIEPEDVAKTFLDKTDNLVICPVPMGGGGGGGKSIFRMVAMIAVAVFAPYAAGALYGALGGTLVAANAGMVLGVMSAGITMAGSMLVNAMLAPAARTNNSSSASGISTVASSPTYGIDGAKNTSNEGIPVPICYGTFRMAGNILSLYVENQGSTQILYMLLNAGEGPVTALHSLRINDQSVGEFKNVQIDIRTGTSNQPIIPWFNDTLTPVSVGRKLGTVPSTHRTLSSVDRLRFDLVFPQGLGGINTTTGNRYAATVVVAIEIQRVGGDGSWIPCGEYDTSYRLYYYNGIAQTYIEPGHGAYLGGVISVGGMFGSAFSIRQEAPADSEVFGSWVDVYRVSSGMEIVDNSTSPIRRSFYSPDGIQRGVYNVRMSRTTPESTSSTHLDSVSVSDINEIILDDISYVNTALVALRIQLDDQLSGVPGVTFVSVGKIIKTWNFSTNVFENITSNNPAWIVLDAMTSLRYGAGMSESRFDMPMFKEWAKYCTQNNLTFDGVIDSVLNVWDAMQPVLRCGHAQIVNVGTRYTVVIERASSPTMMFSVANIISGSFKQNWLPLTDRANEIEVTYFDKTDNYKQRTVKVVDQNAIANGAPQRPSSVTLVGVVDREKAYKEGLFQLNLNRYILQTVEFSAPIEAIACTVGDLIYVQHDMPQWGFAGRTEPGSTASVVLIDRPIAIVSGKQYKLLLKFDAVQRATGSVSSVIGDSLIITGWNGVGAVKRIKSGAVDRGVLATFISGTGTYGVVIEPGGGFAVGATYTLWDTDVIEEKDVLAEPGTSVTSLTVMSPFSSAPIQFTNWMFGEVEKVKKPFRVKTIVGSHDYKRDLVCIEYNESCYDFSGMVVPTPNYSSLSLSVDHVLISGAKESLVAKGSSFATKVTVAFFSNSQSYANSTAKASINGGPFLTIGSKLRSEASVEAQNGDVVIFKVIANDAIGGSANELTAPTLTCTVIGTSLPPSDVTNANITVSNNSLLVSWSPVPDLDLFGYEVREGTSWDLAKVLVSNYSGTSYSVTRSQAGTFTFLIRAIDTGRRYSLNLAIATVTIVPPSSVTGFDCVQNGGRIEFRWNANPEENIIGYEIRQGATWGSSVLVTTLAATTYSMPASSITGTKTFWIKSIGNPGLYTEVAAFSTTVVAMSSDRNLIAISDEKANGWLGSKFNMSTSGALIQLDPGKSYGEYTWGFTLPKIYRARNTIESSFDSVINDTTTWLAVPYSWTAPEATRPWVTSGDLSTVGLSLYIAKYTGLAAEYLEGFGLNSLTSGEKGTLAAQSVGVTYGIGRFLKGAVINDFARLNWSLTIPAVFNTTFWAIPQEVSLNRVFWSALTAAGLQLTLGYDAPSSSFYLEDTLGNSISVPFVIAPLDRILLGVVQTATTRRLYVGKFNGTSAVASSVLAPIGILTSIRLHQ